MNPKRTDLIEKFTQAGLPLFTIEEMAQMAEDIAGIPGRVELHEKIVAYVEYRDGTIIDVVRQSKEKSK